MAASRVMPAPLMPPPTTRTSSVSRPSAASASRRRALASPIANEILYPARAPCHGASTERPVAHRAGGGPAAEIACPVPPRAEEPGDGAVDRVRRAALAHVAEEEDAREDRRERVRQVLPGDVGGGPVHRLEDGVAYAQVRTRYDAEPAHQTGAQVGDDVAVEVLEEQHVERLRPADELQAGVVDDQLLVADAGVVLRHLPGAGEEEAVGELHDVRLVDGDDFSAVLPPGQLEGEARDAPRGARGDHLDALHHAGRDRVLDARVEVLRILAHHHEIDARERRAHPGTAPDRP